MTPAQLLSALAAVRHYARHVGDCRVAFFGEEVARNMWRTEPCSCGLRDALHDLDAMLAGRDVGQPESPTLGCGIVRNAGDWPEDLALENGNYCCRCATCFLWFQGHKRRVVCKTCAGNPSVTPNSSTTTDKETTP